MSPGRRIGAAVAAIRRWIPRAHPHTPSHSTREANHPSSPAAVRWSAPPRTLAPSYQRISPGIAELVKRLKAKKVDVYLVSGGFRQMIKKCGYKTLTMIGDGATDLEARQPNGADLFICYAGVQMREAVAAKADWVVYDFDELMAYLV
ncbi:hypothetical protein E2562_033444 [Oryza meyeriana var. granulata]|uniref:Phosphoserine phosphatase n=1 Tax=Oryza meyeriana var. granulata TaxID=110450 RepID=A0A6G1E651_9ORYZ|nr:hypothetical protein E2562_033444 [Oryza meyeriana var. granulata]